MIQTNMLDVKVIAFAAAIGILSGCHQKESQHANTTVCQPRPNDYALVQTINRALGNEGTPVAIRGVSVTCNTAVVIYAETNGSWIHANMIGADNGYWFLTIGNSITGSRTYDIQ